MYCKDCKYWKSFSKDNPNNEINEKRGKCSSLKFVDASDLSGLEEGEPLVDYDGNEYEVGANDTLEYSDHESYAAYFSTGGYFGCIHFEKR